MKIFEHPKFVIDSNAVMKMLQNAILLGTTYAGISFMCGKKM